MQSLLKDTFFYSVANWGRRLIVFATAPITIAYFTPSDYGYLSLVNTVAAFCSILGILAVADQGLPRFFIDSKDTTEKAGYVATSFLISGVGVLFMTFAIFISTPIIPYLFSDVDEPIIFTFFVAVICLTQSIYYVGSNMLKWTFRSTLFSKIAIFQAITTAIITICGIIFLNWRVKEVLLAAAVITFGAGVWANISVRQYFKFSVVSKKKALELIAYSWPLLGLNIFAFFTRSLDRIFLAALASLGAVGIFSVSSAVASIFGTIVSGFFFAIGPYVLSTYRETWAPRRYAQFFSVITCFGIISIIGLGLWASTIVMIIRPDGAYHEIGVFIPWILSGTLLYYIGAYFAPGPSIAKQNYWSFIAFVLAGTSNAALNYLLIPLWDILGAGIATAVSSLLAGIFLQVVSNKLYFVPNRWRLSFVLILIFTAAVSLSQHGKFVYNINAISILSRALITIILIILAILPYYQDIRSSGVLQKFAAKFLKTK